MIHIINKLILQHYIHIHIIPIINVHIKSRTVTSRLEWYLIIKIQHQMHITDMPRYRDIMHLVAHVLFQYRHAAGTVLEIQPENIGLSFKCGMSKRIESAYNLIP